MKTLFLILLFSFSSLITYCQPVGDSMQLNPSREAYRQSFNELEGMLKGQVPVSFKRAVFLVENAYNGNELNYEKYNNQIFVLAEYCRQLVKARDLIYSFPDKNEVSKNAAIFSLMTDTFRIYYKDGAYKNNIPFSYDFEDFEGEKNWSQMFVSKLIVSRKGNCHSLPFLYKILSQELGGNAYLTIAPNHIYIKVQNKRDGWYNTELTSGIFPIDAWLMASGYINLDAIRNGLYMDTLSERQSIAVCLTDLGQGYQKKFGAENDLFTLQCCITALKYYPNYINALLLKAETEKKIFSGMMKKYNAKYPKEILHISEAREVFNDMEKACVDIQKLGYRKMPEEMYVKWLVSLKEEKEKYQNKNIIFNPR